MAMIEVNGVRTHYQRMPAKNAGASTPPTVVFVHGLGYDSLASFYLTLAAPLAEAGMDVFTYDLRAHGRSERPATGYTLDDFVDDLAELLDRTGVAGPVHLVGNSFGGTIAFSFAARHPDRVAGIVSIEAEPATGDWSAKMARTLRNTVAAMDDEDNLRWLAETFGAHHARLAKGAAAMIRATSIVEDVPSGPLLDAEGLAAIRCPVLSILGSDGFQSDDLAAVGRLLPDCRTEVIAGQNHSVLVERHRTVRELVLDWVDSLHERAAA
ncbi:alpha/beta fold hydrolase [Actinokineospora spheciospongiae]|nr:alpha/beta hydrolase [Actinokineospora spheciospongiae]PWW54913.1 alpha-beta hydrolase superfamily lysophospholipase [Actinokineospora spheciospongiae]